MLKDAPRRRVACVKRECQALDESARIRNINVVATLERITPVHGFPKRIKVDNGPEFISKDLDRWAHSE